MSTTGGPHLLASQKSYQVWVIDGGIHSGFDNASAAENTVAAVNKEAEKLGLKTRYEVRQRELEK